MASDGLPPGKYYAKLTISGWQEYNGRPFRLLQGTDVVYGNQIEPPASGFPLEYRNIIVSSRNKKDFSLNIDAPYSLAISEGAFSTPEQIKYDEQYGVKHVNGVYYSLRGNTSNPKKIFITFPGFGPSTSRISYAVSYLKDISESDLSETLMICFQDRYLAAGSYMMVDSGGRALYDRVWQEIERFRSKFRIDESQMLFFGASKGGSIAIEYAKDYPKATLLLAVPQMNLSYYFNKPFFRDNLFRNTHIRKMIQPGDRLRQYFDEKRVIHYFYTNSDELSNFSIVELVRDVENLSKYRVDGSHSSVARTALPAMLGIIRGFMANRPASGGFKCDEVRVFDRANDLQIQLRVDAKGAAIGDANWFLEGSLGNTRFLQLLTNHSYPFVKFSGPGQSLQKNIDPIDKISWVTAIEPTGKKSTSPIAALNLSASKSASKSLNAYSSPRIELETSLPLPYVVVDGSAVSRFLYETFPARLASSKTLEIHFVSSLGLRSWFSPEIEQAAHVAIVETLDDGRLSDIFALRMLITAGLEHLRIIVHDDAVDSSHRSALLSVDWPGADVKFL